MPRRSSVKQLPTSVINALNFHLEKERLTLDDLCEWLEREHGYKISRSSLHRYSKDLSDVRMQLRQSREIAEGFARELGPDAVTGKQGALLIEMVHSLLFKFIQGEMSEDDEDGAGLTSKNFMELCRAIKDVAGANRLNQDFETKLREQVQREERDKAAAAVDAVASDLGEKGMSADTVAQIKARILGIKPPEKET